MKKVIICKGLPASGKTTFAKELLAKEPGKWKRINKDDLRAMLDNGKWSKANEEFVLDQRDFMITTALIDGHNVVIDDTNLAPKHEQQIRSLVEAHNNALHAGNFEQVAVEIADFTNVPLEECIKRDQKRANYVGEKVIKQMFAQFLRPAPKVLVYNPALPNAILCDLDGTLALFGKNNPYDRDFTQDILNAPVADILGSFGNAPANLPDVILVSGRKNKFLDQTKEWLKKHDILYDAIHMPRADDDNRKDVIIKQEIYEQHIKGKYNVLFVLDDRNQVVDYWRSEGLTCLQVAEGDF